METLVHLVCTSSDLSCVYAAAPYFFLDSGKLYSNRIAAFSCSNDFSPKSTLYCTLQNKHNQEVGLLTPALFATLAEPC